MRRAFLVPSVIAAALLSLLVAAALATLPVQAKAPALRAHPNLGPFEGVGAWIDLYDARSWARPRWTVEHLAAHGVGTIYLQTGNDARTQPIVP